MSAAATPTHPMTSTLATAPTNLDAPANESRWLVWVLLPVGVGLLWRFVRYFLQFPIWGDETMLAVNFVWLDYEGLTQRLENCQIAPILFLWGELTMLRLLGPSELSLRLLPLLAGLGSLILFWRLTGLMLPPRARLFAMSFLAVAIWPVSMCSLIKPYSFDLFMSLVLLLPAVKWLQDRAHTRWLWVLTALAPIAMLGSFPAAFIAGSISLALLLPVWRQGWPARVAFAAFNLAVLASFALALAIGRRQLATAVGAENTESGMTKYWHAFFPPGEPLALLLWLLQAFSGQMFAYPAGDARGGSSLTVLFVLAGILLWKRTGRRAWLALFLCPFLLGLLASALRRYPFGGSCRLAQYLAPVICILAGAGLAWLIERSRRGEAWRSKCTIGIVLLFATFGLVGAALDVRRPFRDYPALWARDVMHDINARVPRQDLIVVEGNHVSTGQLYMWYWSVQADRMCWHGQVGERLTPDTEQVWAFHFGFDTEVAGARLEQDLKRIDPSFRLAESIPYELHSPYRKDLPEKCTLFRFRRNPARLAGLDS